MSQSKLLLFFSVFCTVLFSHEAQCGIGYRPVYCFCEVTTTNDEVFSGFFDLIDGGYYFSPKGIVVIDGESDYNYFFFNPLLNKIDIIDTTCQGFDCLQIKFHTTNKTYKFTQRANKVFLLQTNLINTPFVELNVRSNDFVFRIDKTLLMYTMDSNITLYKSLNDSLLLDIKSSVRIPMESIKTISFLNVLSNNLNTEIQRLRSSSINRYGKSIKYYQPYFLNELHKKKGTLNKFLKLYMSHNALGNIFFNEPSNPKPQ